MATNRVYRVAVIPGKNAIGIELLVFRPVERRVLRARGLALGR